MNHPRTTPKHHVAFDMDDTLCSFMGPVLDTAKRIFKRHFQLPVYGRYPMWFRDSLEGAEHDEMISAVYNPDFYLGLPSVFSPAHSRHTVESISKAAWELYESVSIVTARQQSLGDDAVHVTREWLRLQKFHRLDEVVINVMRVGDHKSDYLKMPSVIVEDSIQVAEQVLKTDHRVILLTQPWNSGFQRQKNCRITSTNKMHDALVQSAQ